MVITCCIIIMRGREAGKWRCNTLGVFETGLKESFTEESPFTERVSSVERAQFSWRMAFRSSLFADSVSPPANT